ncbi:MAG: hypothetical protein NC489_14440 [Ruminococcus flavefaciens]|nr:hypothetical protein [Ruminococcus flavefaciens]
MRICDGISAVLTVKIFLTMSVNGYPFRSSGKDWLETIHELSLLGQLYLKNGIFCGKRILSEKWVEEATKLHINNSDGGYGYFFG